MLLAKFMSDEDLPDSDQRKCFSIVPILDDQRFSFHRPTGKPTMVVDTYEVNPFGEIDKSNEWTYHLNGTVYIIDDGKTVATFKV